jgi:hypothetical protein
MDLFVTKWVPIIMALVMIRYIKIKINRSSYYRYIHDDIQKSRRIGLLKYGIIIILCLVIFIYYVSTVLLLNRYDGVIIDYGDELDDRCYSLQLLVNITESVSRSSDNWMINVTDFNTVIYIPNNCDHMRSIDEIKDRYPINNTFENVYYDQYSELIYTENNNKYLILIFSIYLYGIIAVINMLRFCWKTTVYIKHHNRYKRVYI